MDRTQAEIQKEEWDDILVILQLNYMEHHDDTKLKTGARFIRLRTVTKECRDFLALLQRHPAPIKRMMEEIKLRRPDDMKYYPNYG